MYETDPIIALYETIRNSALYETTRYAILEFQNHIRAKQVIRNIAGYETIRNIVWYEIILLSGKNNSLGRTSKPLTRTSIPRGAAVEPPAVAPHAAAVQSCSNLRTEHLGDPQPHGTLPGRGTSPCSLTGKAAAPVARQCKQPGAACFSLVCSRGL